MSIGLNFLFTSNSFVKLSVVVLLQSIGVGDCGDIKSVNIHFIIISFCELMNNDAGEASLAKVTTGLMILHSV